MTVAQLIDILKKYPPDILVEAVYWGREDSWYDDAQVTVLYDDKDQPDLIRIEG